MAVILKKDVAVNKWLVFALIFAGCSFSQPQILECPAGPHVRVENRKTGAVVYYCGNCGDGWVTQKALIGKKCRTCLEYEASLVLQED